MAQHHVVPIKIYLRVFLALITMTAITVAVAFLNLHWMNTPIALAIALFKASIVILFFMHVRYNTPLMWLFAGAGFFWLAILLVFTLSDYLTRHWETVPPDFLRSTGAPF